MEVGSISLSHREGSHYFSVLNLRKESLLGTDSRANGELPLCLRDFRIFNFPSDAISHGVTDNHHTGSGYVLGPRPRSRLEPTRKSSPALKCELEPRVGILFIYLTGLGSGRTANALGRPERMPPKAPTTRSKMEQRWDGVE
ncbi:hypothetical protein AnigIFM60653_006060 [Aspergillus niger]|nr:hypothetical protein AnigIFM49718_011145 [Aspergillus niger]GLA05567.1 hypothetical protein AnigIFM60653_006060 [Aspergillus niger]GLA41457.1 hypothetical protein AnigIFM63309_009548 [Aspergillus niger]